MVELQYAAIHSHLRGSIVKIVKGYEKEKCVMMDVDGLALPLAWGSTPPELAAATEVALRIYFRAATVYSVSIA